MKQKQSSITPFAMRLFLIAALSLPIMGLPVSAQTAEEDGSLEIAAAAVELAVEDWVEDLETEDVYADVEAEVAESEVVANRFVYLPLVNQGASAEATAQAAAAHSLVVSKQGDSNDHTCDADCSLREAAEAAAATPEVEIITLPAGVYKLSLGAIALGSTVVDGAGASKSIIDGQKLSGIFTMLESEVTIQEVTIRNGQGPGISQDVGNLTIANTIITGNRNAEGCGGGISSVVDMQKQLTIRASRISKNRAYNGGGICLSTVAARVSNTIIEGNQAIDQGGGIKAYEAGVIMDNSVIAKNRAGGIGGGIYSRFGVSSLENSLVMKNQALHGGAYAGYESAFDVSNSTFSGNLAKDNGGAFFELDYTSPRLHHVTVVFNVADSDNNGVGDGGGFFSSATLRHSLVGKNKDKSGPAPDCAGSLTSETYNLIQNTTGCSISGDVTGNITGVDPQVGPLKLHGGLTQNHLPKEESQAVDAIPAAACSLLQDQRGVNRPRDGNNDGTLLCDIGAVERKEKGS